MVGVTGFAPGQWSWAKLNLSSGAAATLPLTTTGLVTVGLWMREDGLQIDRVLLTTDTNYIPTGFGPAESTRLINQTTLSTTITRTIVYTYDDLYRLTNANYSTGELFAYTYDPAGNRKTQTTLAGTNVYTYDAANRLTQVDGVTYGWDNNGNLLSDGQRTFTYDSADRLTAVTQGAATTQFTYNGDGDRLAQIVAGVTTKYALDPAGLTQVLIETTSGQSTHYLPGLAQYGGNAWNYYLPDRLGSVRQLTDPSGAVMLARSYDPFGNVLEQTGAGQSVFGYTGEQTDPTGLVFLRARYYSPGVGRFLTADSVVPDPLRSVGWNRYAYANNNAIRYTDPSGHCGPLVMPIDSNLGPYLVECYGGGGGGSRGAIMSGNGGAVMGKVMGAISLGIAVGSGAAAINNVYYPFPATSQPPFELSGTTFVDEDINQCYLPGANTGRPNPWQLPPFSWEQPYFGPTTPPFYNNPISLPPVFTANSPWFDEIYYNGTPIRSTRQTQRVRDNDVLDDLAEEYPHIKRGEWRKVEQIFEYGDEEYDLHWFEAQGITERGKVERP